MRTCRLLIVLAAALLAAPSVEAAAIQWTSGPGANGHWYWWSFGQQAFSPSLGTGVALDPDGPGGAAPLAGYTSYLMTITSADEQAFVNAHPDNPIAPYWIAASDAVVEGTWRWVAGPETGQTLPPSGPGFNGWCPGEPNDVGNEDAAVANWCGGGLWNDVPADGRFTALYGIEWSPITSGPAVPEPGTLALLSTGAAAFLRSRRRRQSK